MDAEIPIYQGYLNVPRESRIKKKSCQKYCLLFKSSRQGIERLEICETKDDKNPKIITLENCVKITQESAPANNINIVKKSGTLTLNALNEDDLKEWVKALQNVAFRDKNEVISSQTAIEEDNDLYCSSYGDGLFIVTLIPSEASIRCSIEHSVYMLHLTATELQLKSASDLNNIISKWPYRFIRKYGYRDGKFTFEAGRKCSTGEGVFTLDHTNPQEVFRCMSSKMKSMKKMISNDVCNIDSCENQLSIAAASMEPGSRSPLPPSPSNQHSASEFEINSTQSSIRGLLANANDSLNSQNSLNLSKIIPNKPPRKICTAIPEKLNSPTVPSSLNILQHKMNINEKSKKFDNFEAVAITTTVDPNKAAGSTVILKPPSPNMYRKTNMNVIPQLPARNAESQAKKLGERDYECIENITDAWKTLGINDVKHSERAIDENCSALDTLRPRSNFSKEKNQLKESPLHIVNTPKIIDIDIGEGGAMKHSIASNNAAMDMTYDRLDFLSANNKTSSRYTTIVTVSSTPGCPSKASTPSQNDYELIDVPDISSCRKADDSHLGYGILRKSPNSGLCSVTSSALPATPTSSSSSSSLSSSQIIDNKIKLMPSSDDSILGHHNCNGLSYTIVSKPKRV